MAKDYVKQHVVPQSYLRRFATPKTNGHGYYIGVRMERGEKVITFVRNVKDVACEDNYYDVSGREDPKYWEHYFANHKEPPYGKPLDSIISAIKMTSLGHNVLNAERKTLLSKMICFQIMRVPEFLDKRYAAGKQIGLEMKNEFFSRFGHQMTKTQKREITDILENTDFIKDQTLAAMTDEERLQQYEKILFDKVWTININNTRFPYFTSDRPVVMYNYMTKTVGYENNGIGRTDTIIYYPISSRYLIQIFPKVMFTVTGFELNTDRIMIEEDEYRYVAGVNCLQMINTAKQTYMEPGFLDYIEEVEMQQREDT